MQKAIIYFFFKLGTNYKYRVLMAALLFVLLLSLRSTTTYDRIYYKVRDSDPGRGAATVKSDIFGDSFQRVAYLPQNWSPDDSLWFYTTTQGSDLLPYDFFLFLEQEKSTERFSSTENMNRFRYLPQNPTPSNPDGLPVGMVADFYRGKKFMGFTCAACHSSQVNYRGVGIRIDGGPGGADMDGFMKALAASLDATNNDTAKRKKFVEAVLKAGNYSSAADVEEDLKTYALRMNAYNFFNHSPTEYGFARLDAFGRIYNRVLEHILNRDALREVLVGSVSPQEAEQLLAKLDTVLSSSNRDHVMERLALLLNDQQRELLRNKIFNPADAPVSYPFLWDIPQHDYVQWNGIAANAGVGPIGRNTGEVIGVFGTLDWEQKEGWSLFARLGGQPSDKRYISFKSSVDIQNLRHLEDRLWSLQSPLWEDAASAAGLPAIDKNRRDRGAKLFKLKCAECHTEIERASDGRRVVAHMDKVSEIGTDPKMAENSVNYVGQSGIIRNWYASTDVGNVLLNTKAPVAALLTVATQNVVATPDPDKWFFTRFFDWAGTLISEYTSNKIKPSVKSGKYTPDTPAAPFESLRAYKGRPLNGIWATAPYLHNGSVPTLYDLLLPAECEGRDVPGVDCRPTEFMVGSRELDAEKVGFKSGVNDYRGFLFDTSKPGNSNKGHEYDPKRELTREDRLDLVEYMKSL